MNERPVDDVLDGLPWAVLKQRAEFVQRVIVLSTAVVTGIGLAFGVLRYDAAWWTQPDRYDGNGILPAMTMNTAYGIAISTVFGAFCGFVAGYAMHPVICEVRAQALAERVTIVALASSSRMNSAKKAAMSANTMAMPNATCTPVSALPMASGARRGSSAPYDASTDASTATPNDTPT